MDDMLEQAKGVALQAGALSTCPVHEHVTIRKGDYEAERRAYAIGTEEWRDKRVDCTREEFMEAIKAALDEAVDECTHPMHHKG